jgi:hypothetical protein
MVQPAQHIRPIQTPHLDSLIASPSLNPCGIEFPEYLHGSVYIETITLPNPASTSSVSLYVEHGGDTDTIKYGPQVSGAIQTKVAISRTVGLDRTNKGISSKGVGLPKSSVSASSTASTRGYSGPAASTLGLLDAWVMRAIIICISRWSWSMMVNDVLQFPFDQNRQEVQKTTQGFMIALEMRVGQ